MGVFSFFQQYFMFVLCFVYINNIYVCMYVLFYIHVIVYSSSSSVLLLYSSSIMPVQSKLRLFTTPLVRSA